MTSGHHSRGAKFGKGNISYKIDTFAERKVGDGKPMTLEVLPDEEPTAGSV